MYTAEEERLSGQLAAVEMLKSGTTCFLEAGTIRFVDEVMDGLDESGIRGRIGKWVWDLPPEPSVYRQDTDEAIANLRNTVERFQGAAGGRLGAWSMLVGHTTCSDPLWQAARATADEYGVGLSFHMSPAALDPDTFIAAFGQRPMVHLGENWGCWGKTPPSPTAYTSTTTRSGFWPRPERRWSTVPPPR